MAKITKIYTRGGDEGLTSLGGGQRLRKDAVRIAAYGTVDELNAHIGLAVASDLDAGIAAALQPIRNELFHLGSDLCILEEDKERFNVPRIEQRHVDALEELLDGLTEEVGPLENFILPGGTTGAAHLHVARTVCRRAERLLVTLAETEAVGSHVVSYLNRLSDALFVLARAENRRRGVDETCWDSRA
ncbi:MAG: cob(I)yrinic acid a,c-diamide adenosyltransferase [bacterium]|nr:cob(I)yrinic acid a,c-diamide adenosyltransferase [bacterium]